jgi:DNA-binding GntR family transcriptional regulator
MEKAANDRKLVLMPTRREGVIVNESVYEAIKRQILNNQLRPGHKLGHQELAESLGVSRTPIRESLERLYQEGFVIRVPNRGYYVAEISADEARELYETREALEVYELRRTLARGITPQDLAMLEEINERYRQLVGGELTRQRLLVDRDFHLALAGISGNQYLCKTLASIFERLILKRRVDGYHDTGATSYAEHLALLEGLKNGNVRQAERALSGHVIGAGRRLLRYVDSLHESPDGGRPDARIATAGTRK